MRKRKQEKEEELSESSESDTNPIAEILQKLTSKRKQSLSSSDKCKVAKYLTIAPKENCKKRRELNEPIIERLQDLPEKNVYSYMWSLLLSTCLTEMKQRSDNVAYNSDLLVEVFICIVKNIHDVCQKVNLFQSFWSNFHNNFTFTIIVNDAMTISSPCLKKEPIFAAFTPEFTMSDSEDDDYDTGGGDEEEDKRKKRKSYIILNINVIQKLFEQYLTEQSSHSNSGESGLFFVTFGGKQTNDMKREIKQMYKLLLILSMHMLGHVDLFMKYGYCFYESHKKISQFQTISTIYKKKG
jgi:hypothetical protein